MAFCISRGDSFKSLAIAVIDVFKIVESSICIKMEVARIMGNTFLIVSVVCIALFIIIVYSNKYSVTLFEMLFSNNKTMQIRQIC
ncbi:hypothetical protein D3C87_1862180 [compost metagenome]